MCKINPKIDFAFKKLFGSEENKDLLISLINSIITEDEKIKSIELRNPYNLADYRKGKMSILDIKAKDEKERWYNIEMQIGEDLNFDKRSIYYWSKMVTEQLSEGMMFKQLNKTISINILDFNIVSSSLDFHNIYKILNEKTGKNDELHDMFELHYIELKKFRKDYSQIANTLDRWITFLTKANKLDKQNIPKELSEDPEILKAIAEVDRMFNEDEREMYNIRLQEQMEFESKLDSAFEKGIEKGIEKGKKEAKLIMAKKLILKNLSIEDIIEMTELTKDDIENL
jgi:predicted transposase/invertase (TIGR01784 family)